MPFEAGSLEDVEAWARHEFPAYFAATAAIEVSDHLDTHEFDGEYVDGRVILQPMLVLALQVGVTNAGQTVYARITGRDDVELFSHHEFTSSKDVEELLWYMKPVVVLDGITLSPPFCYLVRTGHQTGVNRLETLIRYMHLKGGEEAAVHPRLGFFEAHFQAACRDVARGTGAIVESDETQDDATVAGDSPPGLIEDTDVDRLCDNPAATTIFNAHVHAMDESYHDFKMSVLRRLGPMQAVDKENMVQLQAQNQDLERRLAVSEQGRVQLAKELEAEQAKSKTALEEIERWKTQYEGLKGTLQGALGQRF